MKPALAGSRVGRQISAARSALVKRTARIVVKSFYSNGLSDAQLGCLTVRDLVFTVFARRIADLHTARAATWRYCYGYVPSAVHSRKPGVAHSADIALVLFNLAPVT